MAVLTISDITNHKFDSAPIISVDKIVRAKINKEIDLSHLKALMVNQHYTFDKVRFEFNPSIILCLEFIDEYSNVNIYITDSDFKMFNVTPILHAQLDLLNLDFNAANDFDGIAANIQLSKVKTVLSNGDFKEIGPESELYNPIAKECLRLFFMGLSCFAYINSIDRTTLPSEIKRVKKHHKGKKHKGQVKYLSVPKYCLTGQERRIRTKDVMYTTDEWEVRGHWRHYKNGKKVWIKASTVKRNDKLLKKNNGRNKSSMFKIT